MARIVYGINNIPKKWLDKLQCKDYLFEMFNKFEKTIICTDKSNNGTIN